MRKPLALALLLSACVVHERTPPRPPPPAPAPHLVEEREAVRIAADYARARGLDVDRYKSRLDRHGHWRVEMRSDQGKDRARVLIDGRTGRVLRAKLKDASDWDD